MGAVVSVVLLVPALLATDLVATADFYVSLGFEITGMSAHAVPIARPQLATLRTAGACVLIDDVGVGRFSYRPANNSGSKARCSPGEVGRWSSPTSGVRV